MGPQLQSGNDLFLQNSFGLPKFLLVLHIMVGPGHQASLHHYYYSTSGSSLPSTSTSSPPPLVATIYSGLLGERGAWGLKSKFYRGCSDLTESVTPPQRLPSLPPLWSIRDIWTSNFVLESVFWSQIFCSQVQAVASWQKITKQCQPIKKVFLYRCYTMYARLLGVY